VNLANFRKLKEEEAQEVFETTHPPHRQRNKGFFMELVFWEKSEGVKQSGV
jgi:hypothetical protein